MLIWQVAVVLDARRLTGGCRNYDKYDEQIIDRYERALDDGNEEIWNTKQAKRLENTVLSNGLIDKL